MIIAATLGIAACDSDEPTLLDNRVLTQVGLIKMEPNSLDADFSRGVFGQLDTGLTAHVIESSFAPSTDVCEVTRTVNAPAEAVPPLVIFDQRPVLISAGENVIVSSDAGTYVTLTRQQDANGPFYGTDTALTGAKPSGLIVDVPGEQFPTFTGVAFTDVVPLQFTGPSDSQAINAATEFTWVANNVNRSVIEIYLGATDVSTNEVTQIGCTVVDDGSFSFSAEVRDQIGANFIADWSTYLRIAYNVARSGDAIVFTANSVESQ